MSNWTTSIKKFVNGQRKVLKVECYHGDSREDMLELLAENKLDVLVTSYNTLASDYKKYLEHLEKDDDEDEEQAEDVVATVKKPVEKQYINDVATEVEESSRPRRATRKNYAEMLSAGSDSDNDSGFESDDHGGSDDDDESLDESVDDEEFAGEWDEDNDEDLMEEPMFIFEHSFHRIVLDGTFLPGISRFCCLLLLHSLMAKTLSTTIFSEAQQIRNSKTDFNKAVMSIDAKHKWALTGTPFVNKPADIQTLLQCKFYLLSLAEILHFHAVDSGSI
jgi:SNF2 family DNA or RNA helicase